MEDDEDDVDINDQELLSEEDLLSTGSSEIRSSSEPEVASVSYVDNDDDYYDYYEEFETDEDYFRRKQRELRAERLRRMQERRRAWVRKIYSK